MKFFGKIGFAITENDGHGIWTEKITEKEYSGDVVQFNKRRESGEHINDGLQINAQISVLCQDPWFLDHLSQIRYVWFTGAKWIVDAIDPTKYPSVLLTLGGLYHGDEPEEDEEMETSGETGGDSGE